MDTNTKGQVQFDNSVFLPKAKKTATFGNFLGKHLRNAQRLAGKDTDKMQWAMMICSGLEIDGKRLVLEDLDELHGMDVLAIMGEFFKDEDGVGNEK